jgi:hypothetical protein
MPVDIAYFGIDFFQTSPTLLGKKKQRGVGLPSQEYSAGFACAWSKIATIAN